MPEYRIGQAAELLGVSADTMRRWADAGQVKVARTAGGRRYVDGEDLARFAVEQAKSGLFQERAMRLVPESYKKRFFHKTAAGAWQACPVLTQMVAFRQHNLLERLRDGPFDLVFLKNVLIYFAPESKKRVIDNLRSAICPRGMLVVGPTEGVADLVRDYTHLEPWLYQRP